MNVFKDSVYSLAFRGVGMLLSLISVPLLVLCLGEEGYGIWSTVLSIVTWVYLLDLGVGNGLRNELSLSIANDDTETAKSVISSSYIIAGVVSVFLFATICLTLSVLDLDDFFNISRAHYVLNNVLLVTVAFVCINLVASLANGVIYALQRASLVYLFNALGQLFFIAMLVLYLMTGQISLIAIAIAQGAAQLLKNVIETIWIFLKNKSLRCSFHDASFLSGKRVTSFGLRMFVAQLAGIMLVSMDSILIAKLFGMAEVTPYSICYKAFDVILAMFMAANAPYLSAYTAAYAANDKGRITESLLRHTRLFAVFAVLTLVLILLFKPAASIWLNNAVFFPFELIVIMGAYFITMLFCAMLECFVVGIGSISGIASVSFLIVIVNIPLSILLGCCLNLGVNGVLIGSMICNLMRLTFLVFKTKKILKTL